jgi:hypothetical protein
MIARSLIVFTLAALTALPAQRALAKNILPPSGSPRTVSTIPKNGDINPYGVAFVPKGFPTVTGGLAPGDVLVSNFNNKKNLQGTGTTIVRVPASGNASVFFSWYPQTGLTTALAVLKAGFVVVGNFPAPDGSIKTAKVGSLMIIDPNGHVVETLGVPMSTGPWDMTTSESPNFLLVFLTNALTGEVRRLKLTLGEGPLGINLVEQAAIANGYIHRGDPTTFVVAPTGVAYDPKLDVLYVASTGDNAVYAISNAADRRDAVNKGRLVYKDNTHLHGALALALAPNGHLIVSNNDGVNPDAKHPSELTEFTTTGKFLAQFSINSMPGGAFGFAFNVTGAHTAQFAAVDDVENALKIWNVTY